MAVPFVDNRALIRCVKNYKMLYMANHPKYSDARFKEIIWEKIAAALEIPVSLCKRSWFNLRDSYRRTLRKRRDAITDGLPYKTWRYEYEMEFLAPHISIRDLQDRTGINASQILVTACHESESTEPQNDPLDVEFKSTEELPQVTETTKTKRKRDKMMVRKSTAAASQFEWSSNPRPQLDHIDAFLLGIGATLKNFTPRNQSLAKARIFAMVSDMEMQQIQEFKDQVPDNPETRPTNGDAGQVEEFCDPAFPQVCISGKDTKQEESGQDPDNDQQN